MVPCAYLSLLLTLVLLLLLLGVRVWLQGRRKARRERDGGPAVAFFHPYCNAGGGGERVLWCSLRALMHRYVCSPVRVTCVCLSGGEGRSQHSYEDV